jgi:SAM-dependent methyltransferase
MRTSASTLNPFGASRHGYALERIRAAGSRCHLDIGCYDGAFLQALTPLQVERLCGVDVNEDAVSEGRPRYPALELRHVPDTRSLPFGDGTFDSVSLLDVLEHMAADDQRALLAEVRRVLRPGGIFVVTVPGRHVFSALDLGNLKFRFPRLHRVWYTRRHGADAYRYRYVDNPFGLVGDVSGDKRWHEHFSADGLGALLAAAGFEVVDVDGSGLFMRPLRIARMLSPGPVRRGFDRLLARDAERFASANLFVTARRPADAGTPPDPASADHEVAPRDAPVADREGLEVGRVGLE